MDRCSYFIEGRALFGTFPTQEVVKLLEDHGVRTFVDLTSGFESKTVPYFTEYAYINYPIPDRRYPNNWETFTAFLVKISDIITSLSDGELIYIHCKGGHGRSGVVVASLLCYIFHMTPFEALKTTNTCHSKRLIMRDKWRSIGSPQTIHQKNFIYKFFKPITLSKAYSTPIMDCLLNSSHHPVRLYGMEEFPTVEIAFTNYQNSTKKKVEDWDKIKDKIMMETLSNKFETHTDARDCLLRTCSRPLIYQQADDYWGIGHNGKGLNRLGHIMETIRHRLILQQQ